MKNKLLVALAALMLIIGAGLVSDSSKNSNSPTSDSGTLNEGNSSTEENMHPAIYFTFEEIVSDANCIVTGKYIGSHIDGENYKLEFEVTSELYGEPGAGSVFVNFITRPIWIEELDQKYTPEIKFKSGEEYLLILNRWVSIYYDYDWFTEIGNLFIPTSQETFSEATLYELPLDIKGVDSYDSLLSHIKSIVPDNMGGFKGVGYTDSNDWKEIIDSTDLIAEVKINRLTIEGMHNGNTYYSEVLNIYKGEAVYAMGSEYITTVIVKDTVEVGGRYLIFMNRLENSATYTMSSYQSVISMDDPEAISEVMSTLMDS